MSVEKLPSGKYRVRWREEGRHRSRQFDRRKPADAFDAEIKRLAAERDRLGGFATATASAMPLGDFIRRAWGVREVEWEATTKETWGDIIDAWILPLVGEVPLRDLTRARVRTFRTQMRRDGVPAAGGRRKASANRVNAVTTVLSAFCGFAVEEGLIPENPCRDIRRLPHRASKHRAFEPLVFERIRARMTPRDALAVSLMYLGGLRPQEVFALLWRHVGQQTLVIEQAATGGEIKGTKTGVAASIELVAPLREDLEEYRALVEPRADDLVIAGRQGSGVLRLRPWRANVWHPARRAAGVDHCTPYDGRHTFGSLLIHEGRDILEVQRMMRHASSTMTLGVYAHEMAEWKGRAKVTLVEAVRAARAQVAAEFCPAHPDARPEGETACDLSERTAAPDLSGTASTFSVPHGDDTADADESETLIATGMGVTGLEPVTPSLSSLPGGEDGVSGGDESGDGESDPDDPDDPGGPAAPIAPSPRVPQMYLDRAAPAAAPPSTEHPAPLMGQAGIEGAGAAAAPPSGESFEPQARGMEYPASSAQDGVRADIDDLGTEAAMGRSSEGAAPRGVAVPPETSYLILRDAGDGTEAVFATADEGERDRILETLRRGAADGAHYFADLTFPGTALVDELLARHRRRREIPRRIATEHLRAHDRAVWMLSGARP